MFRGYLLSDKPGDQIGIIITKERDGDVAYEVRSKTAVLEIVAREVDVEERADELRGFFHELAACTLPDDLPGAPCRRLTEGPAVLLHQSFKLAERFWMTDRRELAHRRVAYPRMLGMIRSGYGNVLVSYVDTTDRCHLRVLMQQSDLVQLIHEQPWLQLEDTQRMQQNLTLVSDEAQFAMEGNLAKLLGYGLEDHLIRVTEAAFARENATA